MQFVHSLILLLALQTPAPITVDAFLTQTRTEMTTRKAREVKVAFSAKLNAAGAWELVPGEPVEFTYIFDTKAP